MEEEWCISGSNNLCPEGCFRRRARLLSCARLCCLNLSVVSGVSAAGEWPCSPYIHRWVGSIFSAEIQKILAHGNSLYLELMLYWWKQPMCLQHYPRFCLYPGYGDPDVWEKQPIIDKVKGESDALQARRKCHGLSCQQALLLHAALAHTSSGSHVT